MIYNQGSTAARLLGLSLIMSALLVGPASAQDAVAACPQPKAPAAPALSLPPLPVKPGQLPCDAANKCKKAEIDGYNAAVTKFNDDAQAYKDTQVKLLAVVNGYIDQLNDFAKATQAYARCEHDRVVIAIGAKPNG
jgi:hypothetical protein